MSRTDMRLISWSIIVSKLRHYCLSCYLPETVNWSCIVQRSLVYVRVSRIANMCRWNKLVDNLVQTTTCTAYRPMSCSCNCKTCNSSSTAGCSNDSCIRVVSNCNKSHANSCSDCRWSVLRLYNSRERVIYGSISLRLGEMAS